MNPESRSLVFMMATAAKQIHSSNLDVIAILPMVVESIAFSGQRLRKLEGAKQEDREMDLLFHLADFPFNNSLSPGVLNLLWETCQVLLARKE